VTDADHRVDDVTSVTEAGDIRISNGFLPMAALEHPGATATGLLDLALPLRTFWPAPALVPSDARDQLLLIRLHGQPVAIAHLERAPGPAWETQDVEALWQACGRAIVEHVRQCGCMPEPHSAEEMLSALAVANPSPRPNDSQPGPSASVIIATTGRLDLLQRCLDSLAELDYPNFEVVVVDNRPSGSATRELVESYKGPAPVRYVAEPRPGLSIARNTGVGASSGEVLAFTDDDVVVDSLWLAELLAPFAAHQVAGVTGLVLPLTLASPVQKRFELYAGFGKGVERQMYDMSEHSAADRLLYPYWGGMFGSGNSMAFRASSLAEIGGFDPALGAGTPTGGGEDIAAFSDVILRGGQIVYEPRSICWHEHRADEAALTSQVYNYGVGFSAVLWRYLTHDPRFLKTAIGSIPLVIRLIRRRSGERSTAPAGNDLAALEAKGRLVGPWRYVRSRFLARRAGAL
jgi:O-antigen biosynthesis protein